MHLACDTCQHEVILFSCLQAKAKGRGEDDDDTSGRPSEWAGFVYNPYSGDLLPQVSHGTYV